MSISIKKSSAGFKNNLHCNLLPASIEADSAANVEDFFETTVRNSTDSEKKQTEEFTASLRGRPLNGSKINVPEGYTGVVFKEKRKPFRDTDDREFKAIGQFKELVHWNLDQKPSKNDKITKALIWINIANAINSQDTGTE